MEFPGLEVEMIDKETGEKMFRKVKPMENTLVANLGDMFSRMTGHKLKATMHRVADIGCKRYSVPFFFEPAWHAEIPDDILKPEEAQTVKYGEYVAKRMMSTFGQLQECAVAGLKRKETYQPI